MLGDIVEFMCCPIDGSGLEPRDGSLGCPAGHTFDVARQGYANLLTGTATRHLADTAEMVAARARFLAAGHYTPITAALAESAAAAGADDTEGCVVDAGGGTGHYLEAVLDRSPGRAGVAMDLSKHALRRAARCHPRAGAFAWDIWRPWPLRGRCAAVVLNVFAPRNTAEFHRILWPGGSLIVVTPTASHLNELTGDLDLLKVDPRKVERLTELTRKAFTRAGEESVEFAMLLTREEIVTLVAMGPSARHTDPDVLRKRLERREDPLEVTGSVRLTTFRAE